MSALHLLSVRFACALIAVAAVIPLQAANETPGAIAEAVVCQEDPKQSYALYLPSSYTPDRAWPILFCFDPAARGLRPVERFRAAAERFGWIVVGSNNSRNNQGQSLAATVNILVRDTHQRFRIDPRRRYAAGFSGGARVACAVATQLDFAGVVACGAGFSGSVPPKVSLAFFGCAGREDFNYLEMCQLDQELAAGKARHRLVIFEGEHQWLPDKEAVEALAWLELNAMRSGLRPRDDAFVDSLFGERFQAAAALNDDGRACEEYLSVAADFEGLADVAEAARKAAALKETKSAQRSFKDEQKARRQEQRWAEMLREAVGSARTVSDPRVERPVPLPPGPSQALFPSDDSTSDFGRNAGFVGRSQEELTFVETDRYAALRRVVRDITREARTNVAARRALNGAYGMLVETGRVLSERNDHVTAADCFEAASIIRPERPGAYAECALATARSGDKEGARKLLKTALAKGLKDPTQLAQLQGLLAP